MENNKQAFPEYFKWKRSDTYFRVCYESKDHLSGAHFGFHNFHGDFYDGNASIFKDTIKDSWKEITADEFRIALDELTKRIKISHMLEARNREGK